VEKPKDSPITDLLYQKSLGIKNAAGVLKLKGEFFHYPQANI
jgi:hypothetical protein